MKTQEKFGEKIEHFDDIEDGHAREQIDPSAGQQLLPLNTPGKSEESSNGDLPSTAPPLDMLLIGQLAGTVERSLIDKSYQNERAAGAIDLYRHLDPANATESILARLAVGLTNAAMEGLQRAAGLDQTLQARHMELRLSQKSATAVVDVLNLLNKLQGPGSVTVGSVNVGSGGQAIVGTIQSASSPEKRRVEAPPPSSIGQADDPPEAI
jgi:hypothetical protein